MERPSALGRIDELFGDERRPEQFDLELTAERLSRPVGVRGSMFRAIIRAPLTFTLLNPCFAGFAQCEIQQGESSPLEGRGDLY